MKVQSSEYLKANKALYKELLDKLLNTYEYASILAADSVGKVYSVSKSGINMREDDLYTQRGFVVKVYNDGSFAEYSGSKISKEEIEDIVNNHPEDLPFPDVVIPGIND